LGKSGSETFELLETAYGDDCLSQSKVFEWYAWFKNGRHSLEGDPRDGRLSTSTTDENVERAVTHENILNKIVTGDESWCFQYDPSTKCPTVEWRGKGEG